MSKNIKDELLKKSQEAAISAVQIYNNPLIKFKSENFIVLMVISWTYLLHAYYRSKNIDYRYYKVENNKKIYDKFVDKNTNIKKYKYWELSSCLSNEKCPLENNTIKNLEFLIGIRNEIEHKMVYNIDDIISAKLLSCCLNYNYYINKLFSIDFLKKYNLSISLQFTDLEDEQITKNDNRIKLPNNLKTYIEKFEENISIEDYNNKRYAYRLVYFRKITNNIDKADNVIEFIPSNSSTSEDLNKTLVAIKEKEKIKYKPKKIVEKMHEEGYLEFNINTNTFLWQKLDAKNISKNYGIELSDGSWYWYDSWLEEVRKYCKKIYKKGS